MMSGSIQAELASAFATSCVRAPDGLRFLVSRHAPQNAALLRMMADPEGVLRSARHFLKNNHRSTIVRVDGLILKRFNCRSRWHLLRDTFRKSDAARTWDRAWRLMAKGVPTAEPIAYADARRLLPVCSYFIMRAIPGSLSLAQYFRKFGTPPPELMRELGRQVARFHHAGFCWNRDMNDNNILVTDKHEIYFVDVDGVRCPREVPPSRTQRDLQTLQHAFARFPQVRPEAVAIFLDAYLAA